VLHVLKITDVRRRHNRRKRLSKRSLRKIININKQDA